MIIIICFLHFIPLFILLLQPPPPPVLTQILHPALQFILPSLPLLSIPLYFVSLLFPLPLTWCCLLSLTCSCRLNLFTVTHLTSVFIPGQRRPTRPFQQPYRCTTSWWRPGPCGATIWRTSLSRTASSTWGSLPSPATSTPAATRTRASPANT